MHVRRPGDAASHTTPAKTVYTTTFDIKGGTLTIKLTTALPLPDGLRSLIAPIVDAAHAVADTLAAPTTATIARTDPHAYWSNPPLITTTDTDAGVPAGCAAAAAAAQPASEPYRA